MLKMKIKIRGKKWKAAIKHEMLQRSDLKRHRTETEKRLADARRVSPYTQTHGITFEYKSAK